MYNLNFTSVKNKGNDWIIEEDGCYFTEGCFWKKEGDKLKLIDDKGNVFFQKIKNNELVIHENGYGSTKLQSGKWIHLNVNLVK